MNIDVVAGNAVRKIRASCRARLGAGGGVGQTGSLTRWHDGGFEETGKPLAVWRLFKGPVMEGHALASYLCS